MLRIYGRANSINVRKVLWVCDELGLAYHREDWGRGYRSTSEPEFQKVSMYGIVPVIDDDGFVLRESNTIVRYLAEKHGRADLYPTDLKTRALVEQWMDWIVIEVYYSIRAVFLGLTVKLPAYTDPKSIEAGRLEWVRLMLLLDAHLAENGPYLMGSRFTIADIPAGLAVNRWFSIPFDKPELKAVAAYYELLSQRPGFLAHGRNGTP